MLGLTTPKVEEKRQPCSHFVVHAPVNTKNEVNVTLDYVQRGLATVKKTEHAAFDGVVRNQTSENTVSSACVLSPPFKYKIKKQVGVIQNKRIRLSLELK